MLARIVGLAHSSFGHRLRNAVPSWYIRVHKESNALSLPSRTRHSDDGTGSSDVACHRMSSPSFQCGAPAGASSARGTAARSGSIDLLTLLRGWSLAQFSSAILTVRTEIFPLSTTGGTSLVERSPFSWTQSPHVEVMGTQQLWQLQSHPTLSSIALLICSIRLQWGLP